MEIDAIKQLIQTDEDTRKAVEKAHQMKADLKQAIEDEKAKISKQTWDQAKQKVTDTKKELDDKIVQEEKDNKEYYAAKSEDIQKTYDANVDKWTQDIFERCIK